MSTHKVWDRTADGGRDKTQAEIARLQNKTIFNKDALISKPRGTIIQNKSAFGSR
jgi:hypothetical protein